MASDLTRRIGGVAAALLCSLSLAACNSAPSTSTEDTSSEPAAESTTESTDTTAEPTDAAQILDATTESGAARAISSWTIEASDMKMTTTNTYDEAGNLIEQKVDGTTAGTNTTEDVKWTYEGNVPTSRDDTTDSQSASNSISTTYATPSYEATGDTGILTLESSGKQTDSDADFTYTDTYELADGGKTVTSLESATKATVPASDGSEGGELNSSETYSFDGDGHLSEFALDLMGSSGAMTVTYDGDTVKVSGDDVDQTWTIETDGDGYITKAVNEEAGATLTVTYTDVASPTDFNRALLKVAPGKLIGDCVYGVMSSDFMGALSQLQSSDATTGSTAATDATAATGTSTDASTEAPATTN